MNGKKILSLLMCMLMIVSLLPVSAFADDAVCSCGTSDPASHATDCPLYKAATTENAASVTIGDVSTEYPTIAEALENVADGATLCLLQDSSLNGTDSEAAYIHENGSLTIDLGGKTLSGTGAPAIIHVKGGTLTIIDSGSGGAIVENSADTEMTYSCLLIEGGSVVHLDGAVKSDKGTAVSIVAGEYTLGDKPADAEESEPQEENKPSAEGGTAAFYLKEGTGLIVGEVSGSFSVAMEVPGQFASALEGVTLSNASFSSAADGYYIALDSSANTLSLVQGQCSHNYVDGLCGGCGAEHIAANLSPAAADGENGWYKAATLSAPNGYTISASQGESFSDSISVSDGSHTAIEYWLKNAESGIESKLTMTVEIKVDGTAPVIGKAEAASVTDNSASIQIEVSDAASGLASVQLVCSDSNLTVGELTDNAFPVSGMAPNSSYTFSLTVKDNAGNSANKDISLTTGKLEPILTAPTAKSGLKYTGEAQELITAGSATGGEIQYSLDGVDYSTAIPSATAAGSYTVWYKVIGDSEHSDIEAESIAVEIGRADPACTVPTGLSATYGQTLGEISLTEGWSWKDGSSSSVGNAGNNKFTIVFTPANTENYNTVEKEIELTVNKKALSITGAAIGEKAYDGLKSANVTSVSLGGMHGSETLIPGTDFTVSGEFNDASVGTGKTVTVTVTLLDTTAAKNYSISGGFTLNDQAIIAKSAAPTVTLSFDKVSYNGTEHKPTATLKDGNTDIPSGEYDVAYADNTKAGTAKVTITDKTGGNYSFSTLEKTFTIEKVELTVAPKAVSVTRGANAPTLTYTVTGLISGEKIGADKALEFKLYNSSGTEVTAANAVKTAGTYTIKWTNMNSVQFNKVENYELKKVETASFVVNAPASSSTNNNTSTNSSSNTNNNSNSNNSSNNTSNYKPPVATTMKPTSTVPISGDSKSIRVDVTVSGSTAAIGTVDLNKLDGVIGKNVDTGTVSVDFSDLGSGKNISTVKLPTNAVKEIAKAAADSGNDVESLIIVLADGSSIEFDAEALGEKASQAKGNDISISIEHSSKSKNLTAAQKTAIGSRDAYDISVISGGKQISDMGGKVSIHAPYTLKDGEKAEGIVVYYVDDNGNRQPCETSYDQQNKRVSWKTDHLSLYMIDYVEPIAETPDDQNAPADENAAPDNTEPTPIDPEKDSNDLGAFLWIMLIALVLMGLGIGVFMILRKMKK